MSAVLGALGLEYTRVLETYLVAGDELALSRAYELGRRAVMEGRGVLDMAVLHGSALENLVLSAPAVDRTRLARAATDVFTELLAPFEMSFRGYRATNEELQRLNENLRRQKEAVEVANQELESFSYSVSHDLRAPLSSIDGFTQVVLEKYAAALDDTGKRYLQKVRDATLHMAQLIDDLLALAHVEVDEIDRSDVDLSALVCLVSERLRAGSPGRDARFGIQVGVHGNGDPRLLGVLLDNLVGNAWKFSSRRERTEIAFGCEQREGRTVYFIRDNGAGFDMSYAAKMFTAFQRFHSAGEFEGTGIGLAIVHRVVRRHGGRIWAESMPDGGATFYFTLGDGWAP
jgi:light-regulated signal transduction histidine kinase (bacteriophytochrome)